MTDASERKRIVVVGDPRKWIQCEITERQSRDAFYAAKAIAEKRRAYKSNDAWAKGMFGDPITPVHIGFIGEIAFAMVMQIYFPRFPAANLQARAGGDGGKDFAICDCRVDVKTTVRANSSLLLREDKIADDTIYVAAFLSGDMQTVSFKGFVTGADAIAEGVRKRGKSKTGKANWVNLVIEQSSVRPMSELITNLRERHERKLLPASHRKSNH